MPVNPGRRIDHLIERLLQPAAESNSILCLRDSQFLNSILGRGLRVALLDNANLSSGGDGVDVTDNMHDTFRQLAIRLTRDMGLRFCGVDIMVNGSIANPCKDYRVLEINAAPGLDHYAEIGDRQKRVVDSLYLKVLQAIKDLP